MSQSFTPEHRQTLGTYAQTGAVMSSSRGLLVIPGDLYVALRAVLAEVDRLEGRVNRWRSWAQFVFGGGGKPRGSDNDLQNMICRSADEWRQVIVDDLEKVEAERDQARAEADRLRQEQGQSLVRKIPPGLPRP